MSIALAAASSQFLKEGTAAEWKWLHGAEDTSAFKFSIALWLKRDELESAVAIIDDNNGGSSARIGTALYITARTPGFVVGRGVSGQLVAGGSADADSWPNDNDYHFFVLTYDQAIATLNAKFYVDAQATGTVNKNAYTPSTSDPFGELHIGVFEGEASGYLDGNIADLRIYKNRILSLPEIVTIYNSKGHDGIVDGLWTRWQGNENKTGATITSLQDIANNKKNATPANSPTYGDEVINVRRRYR